MSQDFQSTAKLATFIHIILIVLALQGSWMSQGYVFYNVLFILSMFWVQLHKDSVEAIHTATLLNLLSLAFDLFTLITFYSSQNAWSISFFILNFLFRVPSFVILYYQLKGQGGTLLSGFEDLTEPEIVEVQEQSTLRKKPVTEI